MFEKNFLSTGDFVRILGTTKNTLFHYDKLGLFRPAVVKENGYRAYSYRQLHTFLAIAYLRKIGTPLKEIKEYMEQKDPGHLETLLHSQLEEVHRKKQELDQIETFLSDHLQQLGELREVDFGKLTVEQRPKELLYCSPQVTSMEERDNLFLIGQFFSQAMTLQWIGSILKVSDIQEKIYDRPRCYFGIPRGEMNGIGHMEIRPEGHYLIGYGQGMDFSERYEQMLQYAQEKGFVISGEGYEEYLTGELDVVDNTEHVTRILLPITPIRQK